jgi:hypothetical protein
VFVIAYKGNSEQYSNVCSSLYFDYEFALRAAEVKRYETPSLDFAVFAVIPVQVASPASPENLPSAADLDAVAAEQEVVDATL